MFDDAKIAELQKLASKGYSINEIAEKYNTSRQVISKYINRESEYQFNLRLTYMYKQFPCTVIDVDYIGKKIKIQNRTDNPVHRAFGSNENPDWKDFEDFLESRCFSKSREDIRDILNELQIDSYDSLQIIEKTQGRCYDDDMWIKIKHFPRIKQ